MNRMSGMTSPSYNQGFLFSTIGLTLEFLSDIIEDTQNFGEFEEGKELLWNTKLSKLTNNVSQFVELTTLLSKNIMVRKRVSIDEIKQSHISLLFIMKGINQAQSKQDYVGIEELIKYELKDNLTQWKIDFIPQAKKLLNT
jgi:hypothetical protein